jgi:hypothetical protein
MPGKHRIGGDQAMLFIASIRERLAIVSLDGDEYANTLEPLRNSASLVAASTARYSRTARSRHGPKQSTAGTESSTASAGRKSISVFELRKSRKNS